ncbi:hypothetical protein [Acinetobacter sp. ANC 4173]|jgi:hypothetical protein|uniref:hypothetical protein n=1 Tax=Acinetobacter sp. ANC 4173 TaxID=2529837 RepID=UPI00103C94D2|nr:hypothetical protein [Acinetobacter sp. ANC 4173]TCB78804.1 hypothetical protein E0H94_11560 [Acinetobacter sp. ANC 4173]
MLAEIVGVNQARITVKLEMIPRIGESVKIMYGPDAELEGEVVAVQHYINQHADKHQVRIEIRPFNLLITS